MTGVWDGSGISWTICKQSAPRSRQITTPTPHHSIFTGQMLSYWRPTNSVKALKAKTDSLQNETVIFHPCVIMQRSRLHDGTYALRVNNQRGSEVRISGERQLDDADLVLEHERHEPLAVLSTSRRQHQQPSTAPRSVVIVENLRPENSVFSVGPEISAWAPSHEGRTYQMRCTWIFDAILACFFSTCTCVLLMITYSKHTQCHKRSSLCSCAFYDLGGAETLFANNQMYRNTVALRSKAL